VKINRPSLLILMGSLTFTVVSFVVTLITSVLIDDFPTYLDVLIPVLSGLFAYGIFYFILRKFIVQRLFLIYRSIQSSEISKLNENIRIDSMMSSVEKNVRNWRQNNNEEIDKLKEQEAFRREFLGNLAHELKTPVFSIQGYLDTLLDGGLEDETVNRSFLERASKATDRMVDILNDLDQLTKLEVNAIEIELRPFDVIELVKEVMEQLELKAAEKNIQLTFDKSYSSIFVKGDRAKIAQVFTNLLVNSIFYGNQNGKTEVSFIVVDELVTVEVSDNGLGIDEKHLPRLFERFYRVEKSRNRNEGGSGLGLAIVKRILEAHGQTISVRSIPGKGSTFQFSLKKSKGSTLLSSRGLPIN
jgi:two-component system phosphate regulon sensor histidine kinase PhoR